MRILAKTKANRPQREAPNDPAKSIAVKPKQTSEIKANQTKFPHSDQNPFCNLGSKSLKTLQTINDLICQMGVRSKNLLLCSFFLLFTILQQLSTPAKSAQDYTSLVYKGCAKQALSDPTGVYSQSLSTLFGSLVQQSSITKFFKTSSGAAQTTISGLYQCRGDLSTGDCYNCVSKLPQLADQLCGKVIAARVQLLGCYILYEVSGFEQISGMQMLYKTCSPTNVAGTGFEMRRDTAFSVMENGIASGNIGFYATSYESVYALGQCEGDLGTADCGDCVKNAVQRAQVECGSSLSGQVYLNKCFITYSYYPNGVPTRASSYSSSSSSSSSGSGQSTGKTVAIILGGTAGVGFLIICALFVRGLAKKRDDF